mmetsp:Transcript_2148/g.5880  ORF Transcript_2148/g.5880 Transcript_2148/m.5880 type:complete len:250 (+) Transcript_2148:175-924(+)
MSTMTPTCSCWTILSRPTSWSTPQPTSRSSAWRSVVGCMHAVWCCITVWCGSTISQSLAEERRVKYGRAFPVLLAEYSTLQPFVALMAGCCPVELHSAIISLIYEIKHNPFRTLVFVDTRRCPGSKTLAERFPVHVIDVADPFFPGVLQWAFVTSPVHDLVRRLVVLTLGQNNTGAMGDPDIAWSHWDNGSDRKTQLRRLISAGIKIKVAPSSGKFDGTLEGVCAELLHKAKPHRRLRTRFHCLAVSRL